MQQFKVKGKRKEKKGKKEKEKKTHTHTHKRNTHIHKKNTRIIIKTKFRGVFEVGFFVTFQPNQPSSARTV